MGKYPKSIFSIFSLFRIMLCLHEKWKLNRKGKSAEQFFVIMRRKGRCCKKTNATIGAYQWNFPPDRPTDGKIGSKDSFTFNKACEKRVIKYIKNCPKYIWFCLKNDYFRVTFKILNYELYWCSIIENCSIKLYIQLYCLCKI